MRQNPLMILAADCRHPDHKECCKHNFCKSCGAHVSGYNCNASLLTQRPDAEWNDWWAACDNADCEHAHGSSLGFGGFPDWIERRKDGHGQSS